MTNIAIRGHKERGKEVIELLEMLGGRTMYTYNGDDDMAIYFIDGLYIMAYRCEDVICKGYTIFTLEEFFEKFPYKVGDRVRIPEYESEVCISKMYWDGNEVQYEVVTDEVEWYSAEELNEFNEPNKEKNNWAKWDLPVGYEFQDKEGNVINTDVIKLVKKQPQYPKTYEECCDVLKIPNDERYIDIDVPLDYNKLLSTFTELLICRDAYWKIAGEQLGLGESWEPDLENEELYCIQNYNKQIIKSKTNIAFNKILIFPTEEMRDAFFENFKDLIMNCKELL